jgi:hypothetical protein
VTKTLGGLYGWQTPFIVQNTGSVATDLEVTFYAFADGSCVTRRIIAALAPGTSYADVPNNDSDLPGDSQFSVVVRSFGAPIVGIVNEHLPGTPPPNPPGFSLAQAMAYDGFTSGATSVFLPNITRRFNGFHTPFIVQNLGNRQATIQANFVSFDGSAPRVDAFRTIEAGRSAFVEPNVEPGLVDGKQYSVTVSSAAISCPSPPGDCQTQVPLAVVVNTHRDQGSLPGLAYATDGISEGATAAFGPYAAKNAGADVDGNAVERVSTIVLQNVGTLPTVPSLTFTPLGGGTAMTFIGPSVAAGGAWSFDPRFMNGNASSDASLLCDPSGAASATCLANGEYSFGASAAGSIAVAVNVISSSSAMGYTGVGAPAGRYFAPNVTRTYGGWTTPILLQSVTATGATVKWFRFSDGALVTTQTVSMTAGSALRIDPRNVGALSDNTQYSVVVEGTGGTIAIIVMELAGPPRTDNAMIYEGFPDPATRP